MPPPHDERKLLEALQALTEYLVRDNRPEAAGGARALFEEESGSAAVFLKVHLHCLPPVQATLPASYTLPHAVRLPTTSLCAVAPEEHAEAVRQNPEFERVVTFRQLRKDYAQYAARRKLARSFDCLVVSLDAAPAFFRDGGRAVTRLSYPVFTSESLATVTREAVMHTTVLKPIAGRIVSLRVGLVAPGRDGAAGVAGAADRAGRTAEAVAEAIAENVAHALGLLEAVLPGGWRNVALLGVGLEDERRLPLLPFYASVLPAGERVFEPAPVYTPDPLDTAYNALLEVAADEGLLGADEQRAQAQKSARRAQRLRERVERRVGARASGGAPADSSAQPPTDS